jgi:hypothetical protein
VGSRQVCEHTLSAQLNQTLAFLKRAEHEPVAARNEALRQALEHLRYVRAKLDDIFAPRRAAQTRRHVHESLTEALAKFTPPGEQELPSAHEGQTFGPQPQALLDALAPLEKRFVALSKLCEATPGILQVNAVARHYGRTATRELPAFEAVMSKAGLTLDLPLPPLVVPTALPALMEVWEDGAEQCLARLTDLRARLEREQKTRNVNLEVARLRRELAELGLLSDELPEPEDHDELSLAAFQAAVTVREAWAKAHAAELACAVEAALKCVHEDRSLRRLFRNDPKSSTHLRRLFGIWGSTLLSLGNCFPPEAGAISHVVIDEAGQCHPAHAVSALLRADAALLIGDVHQLAPILELAADDDDRLLQSCRLRTARDVLAPYRVHSEAWVSAQTLANRAVHTERRLVDHFRCQPEIIAISDALCDYGLAVHTRRVSRSRDLPFLRHPVLMVDVHGEQERFGGSLRNERELHETVSLVMRMLRAGIDATNLAVITPYRGQLEWLRRSLLDLRVPIESSAELAEGASTQGRLVQGLALGTVHRFQGGERSIVLFSSVITQARGLGFLNTRPNLLNVAISRAQHHFVCLGRRAILSEGVNTRLLVQASHVLEAREYV